MGLRRGVLSFIPFKKAGERLSGLGGVMRKSLLICICIVGVTLVGCQTDNNPNVSQLVSENETPPPTLTVQDTTEVKYYPSDEPLKLALEYFNRGHFGTAPRYFRDPTSQGREEP